MQTQTVTISANTACGSGSSAAAAATQTIPAEFAPRRRADTHVAVSASGAGEAVGHLRPAESVPVAASRPSGAYLALKRAIDFVGALAGLVLLFPLYVAIAVLVRLDSHGPVFHRRRVLSRQAIATPEAQRNLDTFDAFKFRTMICNADEFLAADPALLMAFQQNHKLSADPRITPLGRLLRRLSLDEFPQLLNVLMGQMSLVGPRMIAPAELERYGHYREKLLSVKPGLTGLWQVSGRQRLPYGERIRLDMYYIDNRSIALDLLILARTLRAVLTGDGAF